MGEATPTPHKNSFHTVHVHPQNSLRAQRIGGHGPSFCADSCSTSSQTRAPFMGAQQFSCHKL